MLSKILDKLLGRPTAHKSRQSRKSLEFAIYLLILIISLLFGAFLLASIDSTRYLPEGDFPKFEKSSTQDILKPFTSKVINTYIGSITVYNQSDTYGIDLEAVKDFISTMSIKYMHIPDGSF